jgi:hypothetical protein
VPFLAAGLELMVLVDDEAGLVVREERLEEDTNFAHLVLSPADDPGRWLDRVGFPSHAVIVRPNAGAPTRVTAKGLTDAREAELAVTTAARESADGRARIETDMHAHLNPTPMRSIAALALELGGRLATPCPACGSPGFGRAASLPGLPCRWCGRPTGLLLAERWACGRCGRAEERRRPDGAVEADPAHCPGCNPRARLLARLNSRRWTVSRRFEVVEVVNVSGPRGGVAKRTAHHVSYGSLDEREEDDGSSLTRR